MEREDLREVARVLPGQLLAGRYRIERGLGAGGMGVVVAAHHVRLGQKVAIKFLRPHLLGKATAVERFVREAQVLAQLKNEHVARVLDIDVLETGGPYIVMELLEGATLKSWLEGRGPLPARPAVDIVLQACAAVSEAHALGVVHRDLKPSNLFCIQGADGPFIKVLDFGISKLTGTQTLEVGDETPDGTLIGSPHYMSPEQMWSGCDVDGRSDIWALGVILHELLTGRVPFGGEALAEVAIKVVSHPAPPLGHWRPDVDAALASVVARCLEKDRRARYASAADLAAALTPWSSTPAKLPSGHYASLPRADGASGEARDVRRDTSSPALGQTLEETGMVSPERSHPGAKGPGGMALAAVVASAAAWLAIRLVFPVTTPEARAANAAAPALDPVASQELPRAVPPAAPASEPPPSAAAAPIPSPSSSRAARQAEAHPARDVGRPAAASVPARTTESLSPEGRTAKASCDPPYAIDVQGNRVFRTECVE